MFVDAHPRRQDTVYHLPTMQAPRHVIPGGDSGDSGGGGTVLGRQDAALDQPDDVNPVQTKIDRDRLDRDRLDRERRAVESMVPLKQACHKCPCPLSLDYPCVTQFQPTAPPTASSLCPQVLVKWLAIYFCVFVGLAVVVVTTGRPQPSVQLCVHYDLRDA